MSENQFKRAGLRMQCTLCGKFIAPGAAAGHKRRGCEASREPHQQEEKK